MRLDGLHHVPAITADVDSNLDLYGRLLGLRLIWQGLNADDPGARHIAYRDGEAASGWIAANPHGAVLPVVDPSTCCAPRSLGSRNGSSSRPADCRPTGEPP